MTSRYVPDEVVGEHLADYVRIALAERLVRALVARDVGCSDMTSSGDASE